MSRRGNSNPDERLSCNGKIGYETPAQALRAMLMTNRRPARSAYAKSQRRRSGQMGTYYCNNCGMHHWGHTPPSQRKDVKSLRS